MKQKEFRSLAGQLEKQTPHQRKHLAERLRELDHKQAVNTAVESRVADGF